MGFTRSWAFRPACPIYRQLWPRIVGDTQRIIASLRRNGLDLAGPTGYGTPVIGPDRIAFNGPDEQAGDHFTWLLDPPPQRHLESLFGPDPGFQWRFAKTAREPYDLAVAAVLLHAAHLTPTHIVIGPTDPHEWHAALGVLDTLFDTAPGVPARPEVFGCPLCPAPGPITIPESIP